MNVEESVSIVEIERFLNGSHQAVIHMVSTSKDTSSIRTPNLLLTKYSGFIERIYHASDKN